MALSPVKVVHMMMTVVCRKTGILAATAALALAAHACGGGGGGGGGNNAEPPKTPDKLRVVARDGQTFPGGFNVNTIESANMADDRTISIIASNDATPTENAVFVRTASGQIRRVLGPGDSIAQGLSFSTVRNMSMAPTGEFVFEVGNELDKDGVFLWNGSSIEVVARTGANAVPEGFRISGALRVGPDGVVVFTGATSPCEIDSTDPDDVDISCDLRIHTLRDGVLSRVDVPNTLSNQTPTSVIIELNSRGEAVVGMSARGTEPVIGVIRDGDFEGLIPRRVELEGLGTVFTARPRAISPSGAIALDGFLDTDGDGERDEQHVLLYEDGLVTSIERTGGNFRGFEETRVRAEGIDGNNQVVYRVDFEEGGETRSSYRAWQDGRRSFIVYEGQFFGEDSNGNELFILNVDQLREAQNGDVLFTARLGFEDDNGDIRLTSRRLIRWNGGPLETLLELGAIVDGQRLVDEIQIADVNATGDLLIITSLGRDRDRVLLLLLRKDPDELA